MRRLAICLLSVSVSAAACSGANPAAPSPVPAGTLSAKTEKPANVNGVVSEFVAGVGEFSFVVEDTRVRGDADTEFYGESLFEHLGNGARVEVKGVLRPDHVYAKRIHVNSRVVISPEGPGGSGGEDPPPPPPPPACAWPTEGPADATSTEPAYGQYYLWGISGIEPSLVLDLGGRYARTDSSTVVRRNADLLPMSILRPRMTVDLVGAMSGTDLMVTEIRLNGAFDVSGEGEATLVTGDYPEVRFVVGTNQFLANEWTKFSGSACDVLVEGATLRLRGVRMADGVTVLATYIERITP